jgi:putative membrane protein
MFRSILCSLLILGVCVGCNGNTDKEAKITKLDAKSGTVIVKMQTDGKEVEKTFKLAENIEYMDSTGKVADTEIFTSGDLVLIVEREGKITKLKKKEATSPDQTFIRAADQIDLAEVKLGKFAEEHAASAAVKKFGERMVRDHSSMNKELREITSKKGIAIAEQLDQKHQELMDQLSKLKGSEFDRAYTKDMVPGHEKAIEQFENEAKNGRDSDVKAWAEKWLPSLREHLKLAQDAVKDVKGK